MRALLLAAVCLLLAGCGAVLDSLPGRSVTALPPTSAVSYSPQTTYSRVPLPSQYSYRPRSSSASIQKPRQSRRTAGNNAPNYTPPAPSNPPPPSAHPAVVPPPPVECTPRSPASACAWGCTAALSYLRHYANPAFTMLCPAWAWGAQAATCVPAMANYCPGQYLIEIADPCPIAYRNEASNSWTWRAWVWDRTLAERVADGLDPYGPSC